MPIVQRGDVALRLEIAGDPGGPPVVLLHGLGDDRRLWDRMRAFLPESLRLIAYDLRGHGESSAPAEPAAYSMEAFLDDTRAVLDEAGIDRGLLVGFSLGGAIALNFALAHPARVAGVAAINANAAARDPREQAAIVAAAGGAGGASALPGDRERRFVERLVARLSEGARLASVIGRTASIVERADEIEVPVWLIASDRDPGFARRSEALLRRLRRGHRLVVEGAGHAVMLDRPEDLARTIAAFAAAAWPPVDAPSE